MHTYFHTTFGFCLWDALALLVLLGIVVMLAVHIVRQKKREQEFEKELKQKKQGQAPQTTHHAQ